MQITLDLEGQKIFKNGTTLSLEIGRIFNSIAMKRTESFQITTYAQDFSINQKLEGLTIINKQRGSIIV